MRQESPCWKIATAWMAIAAMIGVALIFAGKAGGQGKDANRLTAGEQAEIKNTGTQAKSPKRTRAEAENSCADPAACREANRKAYDVKPSQWQYTAEKDEMRGTTRKIAHLDSPQRLEFQFPYSGGSTVTLYISRQGAAKPVIGLKVDKGQFLCSITGDTEIQVKFGNRPVEPFGCLVASDGSSNVIFMTHPELFLTRLMATKTLMIEARFYREGARQMRFDTAGLDWK